MKSDNATLWIDLTMLLNWQGQLTGIQRVEYNLATRFADRPHTKFCIFNKQQRVMVPYDFEHIRWKVESLQSRDAAATPLAVTSPTWLRRNIHRSSVVARRSLGRITPGPLRARLKRVGSIKSPVPAETVRFNPGDALLILSGDWSDSIFADTISAQRQQQQFKIIQIVYDMLPAVQPSYFVPGMPEQFGTYMQKIFSNCDKIMAISKATKHDIISFQKTRNLQATPVEVFRLGDDFVTRKAVPPTIGLADGQDFILCVGTIEARKNHQLIYAIIKEAQRQKIGIPPIVIVGKKGWLVDNLLYLIEHDPSLEKQLLFLHTATDQELAWLFENCLFTLYPSFFEGWGLPIAESLYYGKYCLSSGASSMPEIAGDLIEYFSPYDPLDVLQRISHYQQHPADLRQKEVAIKNNYKPTSWDASYETFERVIVSTITS